jgi:hypothetical protein
MSVRAVTLARWCPAACSVAPAQRRSSSLHRRDAFAVVRRDRLRADMPARTSRRAPGHGIAGSENTAHRKAFDNGDDISGTSAIVAGRRNTLRCTRMARAR